MIKNIDQIKNDRIKNLIQDNLESLNLSKKLVTIKSDMDIDFNKESFRFNSIKDKENVIKMVNDFELTSIATSLEKLDLIKIKNEPKELKKKDYNLILDDKQLESTISLILESDVVSFDLETTGVDPMS